ncbi:hypothetical protein B0H13DRAFT_1856195 [Mycena leptocephala]|nr:hypothetical protein B0H13DRAFT_1856195 [Mycena leptocephala]
MGKLHSPLRKIWTIWTSAIEVLHYMSIKDVGADFIGQNGISGCIYKDLAETLPRPLQQAFFRIFHWVISCFYLVSLKNVGSILLNNMSRTPRYQARNFVHLAEVEVAEVAEVQKLQVPRVADKFNKLSVEVAELQWLRKILLANKFNNLSGLEILRRSSLRRFRGQSNILLHGEEAQPRLPKKATAEAARWQNHKLEYQFYQTDSHFIEKLLRLIASSLKKEPSSNPKDRVQSQR